MLVYSVGGSGRSPAIDDIGGVSRRYLNHRHEAMFPSDGPATPLFVHERERESVEESDVRARHLQDRHTLDDDLEVIPTPGHTAGGHRHLWDSGRHRFLFTGDTHLPR